MICYLVAAFFMMRLKTLFVSRVKLEIKTNDMMALLLALINNSYPNTSSSAYLVQHTWYSILGMLPVIIILFRLLEVFLE